MNDNRNITVPSTKLFILGCILAILLGVILHFAYDFLNRPFIFGLFTPINESIWEHLKLILVPMTTFGIIYTFIYRNNKYMSYNFWYILTKTIIWSMVIIVFGHYGYKCIFKSVPDYINILIYIIAMIIGFYMIYTKVKNINIDDKNIKNKNSTGIITLILMYLLFIIFTIYPPQVELFKDPINNTFGIFLL